MLRTVQHRLPHRTHSLNADTGYGEQGDLAELAATQLAESLARKDTSSSQYSVLPAGQSFSAKKEPFHGTSRKDPGGPVQLLEAPVGTTHFCRHRSPRSVPPDSRERSDPPAASDGCSGTSDRCCRCPAGWPHTDGTKGGSLKEAGGNRHCDHRWTKQNCYGGTRC